MLSSRMSDSMRAKCLGSIGEFPKIRGTLFWGPYNEDPILLFRATTLGSPIFANSHIQQVSASPALQVQAPVYLPHTSFR